jgi:DNA-binding IclR family transcriptional regulator
MEEKNPIQVSERIFRTIECLAASGPMGLLDLSNSLGLNKTTVHRILNSLICMDYVTQDPATLKYRLTFKLCGIANQILSQSSIIDLARPYIRSLAGEAGETVHLVQLHGTNAIYIDKMEAPRNSIRMISMVGQSVPLYCSGVGKAMLADMTDAQVEEIWSKSEIHPLTPYTITSYDDFHHLLEEVRQNGCAIDNEENELGIRCIAVSIRDFDGKPSYAISISGPKERMDEKRIAFLRPLILQAKTQIQKETGNIS